MTRRYGHPRKEAIRAAVAVLDSPPEPKAIKTQKGANEAKQLRQIFKDE
jgi:hypothetical protein